LRIKLLDLRAEIGSWARILFKGGRFRPEYYLKEVGLGYDFVLREVDLREVDLEPGFV
jgi:hypothetical protein